MRRSTATDIALIAAFAALIAVLGLPGALPIPGSPAPVVLQNLGIMLAGAVLGWKRGTLAVIVFFLLVLVGLPLLPGLPGGPAAFATPRIGFQMSYVVIPLLIGVGTQWMLPRYKLWLGIVLHLLAGIVVCYALGIAGMMLRGGLSFGKAFATCALFVVGDTAKAILAAVLAKAAHKAVPGLTPPLRPGRVVDPLGEPVAP